MDTPITGSLSQMADRGNDSNSSLFVYNIPAQLTGEGLRHKFSEFGTVQRAIVRVDRHNKPVGFVDMTTSRECVRAITALHNKPPLNWIVRLSQSPEERHQRLKNNQIQAVSDPEVEKAVAQTNMQFDSYNEKAMESVQKFASWLNEEKSDSVGSQPDVSENSEQPRQVVYDRRAVALVPKPCVVCGVATAGHCGRCKRTRYCSRACQQRDWNVHAVECCEPEIPSLVMPEEYAASNAPAATSSQSRAPREPQKPLLDLPVAQTQQKPHEFGQNQEYRRSRFPSNQNSNYQENHQRSNFSAPSQHTSFSEQHQQQHSRGYVNQRSGHQQQQQRPQPNQRFAGQFRGSGGCGGRSDHSATPAKRPQLVFNSNNLVHVSHVVNANTIYVQLCEQRELYQQMERELQPVAKNAAPIMVPPSTTTAASSTLYLALFENVWYRSRVLPVPESAGASSHVLVQFVDWGNTGVVEVPHQLRALPSNLQLAHQLAPLAVCVQLQWLLPGGFGGGQCEVETEDRLSVAAGLQDRRVSVRVVQWLQGATSSIVSSTGEDAHDRATAVVTVFHPTSGQCLLTKHINNRSSSAPTAPIVSSSAPYALPSTAPNEPSTIPVASLSTAPSVPASTAPSVSASAAPNSTVSFASMELVHHQVPDNLVAMCRAAAVADPSPSGTGTQTALVLQCLSSPFLTAGGVVVDHVLPLTVFHGDTVDKLDSLTAHCNRQSPLKRECQPGEIVASKEPDSDGSYLRVLVLAAKGVSGGYWLFGVDFGCLYESSASLWSVPDTLTLCRCPPLLLCGSCVGSDRSTLSTVLSSSADGDVELQLLSQLPAVGDQPVQQLEARVNGVSIQLLSCRHLIAAVIDSLAPKNRPVSTPLSPRPPAVPVSPRHPAVTVSPRPPAAAPAVTFSCVQLPALSLRLKAGDSHQLLPTSLVHPQLVFGQLQNEYCQKQLNSITEKLTGLCSSTDREPSCSLPPVGALLAVYCRLHDKDSRSMQWRRARLVSVQKQQQKHDGQTSIIAHLLDWGCDVTVTSLTHCRPLPESLLKVEALELRFGLFSLTADACPRDQLGFYRDKLLGIQFRMLVQCVVDDMPQAVLYRENVEKPYVFNERMLSRINAAKNGPSACDKRNAAEQSLTNQVSRLSVKDCSNSNRTQSPNQQQQHQRNPPHADQSRTPPRNPSRADQSRTSSRDLSHTNHSGTPAPNVVPNREPVLDKGSSQQNPIASPSLPSQSKPADKSVSASSSATPTIDCLPSVETALALSCGGQQLAVMVCDVAAPDHFTATPLTDSCLAQLERVEAAGQSKPPQLLDKQLKPDQLVMVLSDLGDGATWCRACLLELCDGQWTVYLIDHGTIAMPNTTDIAAVPPSLLDIPPLAVNIQLVGDFIKQLSPDQLQRMEQLLLSAKQQSAPLDIQLVSFNPAEELFTAAAAELFKQLLN